jgi:murein DD-endopeptidase MepM/ murein hydrolase activator NlpD
VHALLEKLKQLEFWRHHGFRGRVLPALAAGVSLLLLIAVIGHRRTRMSWEADAQPSAALKPVPVSPAPPALVAPRLKEISDTFKRGETITEALQKHGLRSGEVHQLVESAHPVYNLAEIRAYQPYYLHFTEAGEFRDFVCPVDEDYYLTVYRHDDRFVPVMKAFLYETAVECVSGVIEDSLFMTIRRAGEQDQLAIDLAEIFQWDIDFYTDIQSDDSFRMLVEKKYLEGEFKKYGAILAAEFTVQNKSYSAFRFADGSNKPRYYGYDGKALNKTFLKSPLKFTRISSRFSFARRDPISKIVRPHLGVDYAAPQGTPVVAVASGKVIFAGQRGGYGNLVRLRHNRGYETLYAHLRHIEVRPGAQVNQGQLIGYVGQTGHATGPHLDFRVLERGRFRNPRQVAGPPDPPVSAGSMPHFAALRDELKSRLELSSVTGGPGLQ